MGLLKPTTAREVDSLAYVSKPHDPCGRMGWAVGNRPGGGGDGMLSTKVLGQPCLFLPWAASPLGRVGTRQSGHIRQGPHLTRPFLVSLWANDLCVTNTLPKMGRRKALRPQILTTNCKLQMLWPQKQKTLRASATREGKAESWAPSRRLVGHNSQQAQIGVPLTSRWEVKD